MTYFEQLAAESGLPLKRETAEKFLKYQEILLDWNQRINLTAITEPTEIAVKHFLDSLLLLKGMDIPVGETVIDVGTGAGFPGVPMKLVRPDLKLTLLDSLNKRILFLQDLCGKLETEGNAIHSRAEEAGRKPEYREQFYLATARAVASLRDLAEYCIPFVKIGGIFVAMKGYDIEPELEKAKRAIGLLGGKVDGIQKYSLPDGSRRSLVLIKKISQTPTKYPRPSAKIAKSPL